MTKKAKQITKPEVPVAPTSTETEVDAPDVTLTAFFESVENATVIPESAPEDVVVETPEVMKAKDIIRDFISTITSTYFKTTCEEVGNEMNIPAPVVAKSFIMRCLGVVGDCLGIVIETTRGVLRTLIDLLHHILTKAVNLVCNVANSLSRLVTLNRTAKMV